MGTKQFDSATDLITFTRASGGTALRKISYGSELVTNGTFTGTGNLTGWTLDGDATNNNGVDVFNATAGASTNVLVTCNGLSAEVGKVYKITYDRISGVGFFIFGGVLTTISGVAETTTSYVVATSTGPLIYKTGSGGSTGSMDNVSVKEVIFDRATDPLVLYNHPNNTPRIEYNPDGTVKGLLIEEARTNLVTYSNDFTHSSWTKNQSTITEAASVSPDGGTSASEYLITGSSGYLQHVSTVVANTNHTSSCYIKKGLTGGSAQWLQIVFRDGSSGLQGWFDISNGVIGSTSTFGTGSVLQGTLIEDVGGGYFRCSATGSVPSTSGRMQVYQVTANGSNSRDQTNGIYIYGAQLEAGAFPTSYIPTISSTATRAADVATIPVDNFGYNSDAGSILVEAQRFGTNAYPRSVMIDAGNESTSIGLGAWGSITSLTALIKVGNVKQADMFLGNVGTSAFKNSIAYKENDFAASRDGNTVLTDTSGTVPTGMTTLTIGRNGVTTQFFNGHIKSIQYYPRRLTNAQLQELTT